MPSLAATDSLILLIYAFFVLAAGFSLRPAMTGSREFMQAGRMIPGWLCGMAMLGASMGSQEVLGMGAAGARYGLASVGFFALGSIPAMLFAGLYLMPVFYGSNSTAASSAKTNLIAPRSIPEYLGLRFDQKTRVLNAFLFAAMSLFSAGIALYAMARVFVALHVFDRVAGTLNLPPTGVLLLAMAFARCFGAGLCSARRTWRRNVQPGDAVLPCPCRAAADCPVGTEENRRLERAEGRGAVRFPARHGAGFARRGPCWHASHGGRRDRPHPWHGPRAGRRNMVHGLQAAADRDGGKECGVGAKELRSSPRRCACLCRSSWSFRG